MNQAYDNNGASDGACNTQESIGMIHHRAVLFEKMLLPTLLYAFFFTLFLYENYSSYTMMLFVAATTVYCCYCMEKLGVQRKKETKYYVAGMFLLGMSSFLTGNEWIIFCNTAGIGLLLICMLLHNFNEDRGWGFGRYVHAIFCAVFGAVGCIGDACTDAACYQKETKDRKHSAILYVVIGFAISVPILLVVILLLCSADAVFGQFVRNIRWNLGDVISVSIMFLFGLCAAYCGLRYIGKGTLQQERGAKRQYEPLIAATLLSLLSIVYVFFCLIQILYLFIGKMQLPQNYTYAEYARAGFFQLLFVCILNLVIVLFVLGHFPRKQVLTVLLAVISCCTYIMVVSSAFRMTLYVQNYQLTFLRVLVFWCLAVIALFLAGILVVIYKSDFPLFRYGLVVFSVCYLALSFGRVDYWIASYNLAHAEAETDYWYMANLSTDAAPAIARYAKDHAENTEEPNWVRSYVSGVDAYSGESVRKINFSHVYAERVLGDLCAETQPGCEVDEE
jgi:hypothetical protein